MYTNLFSTIGSLPDDTMVLPGHEYTVANLEFARWVEPDNAAVAERLQWANERRAGKWPTVPSTLAQEKSWNPFMRVNEPAVVARVQRVLGLQAGDSKEPEGVRVMVSMHRQSPLRCAPCQPAPMLTRLCVLVRVSAPLPSQDALRKLKNDNAHQKK